MSINQVLVLPANNNLQELDLEYTWYWNRYLSGDCDLLVFRKTDWAFGGIFVIEDDGHGCLGDTSLAPLIYQILKRSSTNLHSTHKDNLIST